MTETDESAGEPLRLKLADLKRTLAWEGIQKERLLDTIDRLRRENQQLRDQVGELERTLAELRQQHTLF